MESDTQDSCEEIRRDSQILSLTEDEPSKEDFWIILSNEQENINVDYEKAVQELLLLEEPLPNVQSVFTRMFDQTHRYKMAIKRKEAEIKEREEKIDRLTTTLGKFKNSITLDEKKLIEEELHTLKKQVDMSHLREQDLQETVDYLRKQVKNLESSMEQKDIEAAELDADLELMGRTREGMQKDKEKMRKIMTQTEAAVSSANAEREEYARLYDSSKGIIDDLRKQFSEKILEAEKLTNEATGSERAIADLKKNYNELVNEYENLYDMYMDCFKQLTVHRDTNQELAAGIEELFRENEDYEESEKLLKRKLNIMKVRITANERRFAELSGDYEGQRNLLSQLRNQLQPNGAPFIEGRAIKQELLNKSEPPERDLHLKEDSKAQCDELEKLAKEVQKYKDEIVKLSSSRAACNNIRAPAVAKEAPKPRVSSSKEVSTNIELKQLEKTLKEKEKKITEMNALLDHVHSEKRIMAESLAKLVTVNSDLQSQLKSQTTALKAMDQFLSDARQQLRECKNQCEEFKRDQRKARNEKSRMQNRIDDMLEMAKQYEDQLMISRRELVNKTTLLKKEKNALEVVKAERNSQHAKWQEAQSMLQDQKRISKIESTQIQQLREEVTSRDKRLTKEQLASKKMNAKYNSTVMHETKMEKKVEELKAEVSKFEELRRGYENVKKEDELEKQAIMKKQAKFQKEMGVIGTMLDRRLVELGLVYEKVDLMGSMLRQGEQQYRDRMEDIKLLKFEVGRLRYQNQLLQATHKNLADLKQEIYHLNRDLATERLKCHALQEELETPINFHRWRVLEGTDPDKRDLVDKVQILQKKLLKEKENRALEKERFKDLEAVYMKMKRKLTNLPGSDIYEELNKTRKALKDKTDENRMFAATLTAYEGEIQDHKYRTEKLQQMNNELRTKFFDEKRVEDKIKMQEFGAKISFQAEAPAGKAMLGGGFRLEESLQCVD